jgi:hypothetical protein
MLIYIFQIFSCVLKPAAVAFALSVECAVLLCSDVMCDEQVSWLV